MNNVDDLVRALLVIATECAQFENPDALLNSANGIRRFVTTRQDMEPSVRSKLHELASALDRSAHLDGKDRGAAMQRVATLLERSALSLMAVYEPESPRTAFASFSRLAVRNPHARAMLIEIAADRDRELLLWDRNRLGRAWVHVCTAWAICWHLGVFKALSSVMQLVDRWLQRRA